MGGQRPAGEHAVGTWALACPLEYRARRASVAGAVGAALALAAAALGALQQSELVVAGLRHHRHADLQQRWGGARADAERSGSRGLVQRCGAAGTCHGKQAQQARQAQQAQQAGQGT